MKQFDKIKNKNNNYTHPSTPYRINNRGTLLYFYNFSVKRVEKNMKIKFYLYFILAISGAASSRTKVENKAFIALKSITLPQVIHVIGKRVYFRLCFEKRQFATIMSFAPYFFSKRNHRNRVV